MRKAGLSDTKLAKVTRESFFLTFGRSKREEGTSSKSHRQLALIPFLEAWSLSGETPGNGNGPDLGFWLPPLASSHSLLNQICAGESNLQSRSSNVCHALSPDIAHKWKSYSKLCERLYLSKHNLDLWPLFHKGNKNLWPPF